MSTDPAKAAGEAFAGLVLQLVVGLAILGLVALVGAVTGFDSTAFSALLVVGLICALAGAVMRDARSAVFLFGCVVTVFMIAWALVEIGA
jgi:hypothetical protein